MAVFRLKVAFCLFKRDNEKRRGAWYGRKEKEV